METPKKKDARQKAASDRVSERLEKVRNQIKEVKSRSLKFLKAWKKQRKHFKIS